MASISTAIALRDRISSPMQNIQSAVNRTIGSFGILETASKSAFDITGMSSARIKLEQADSSIQDITSHTNKAEQQQNEYNNSVSRGTGAASGLESTVKRIATAALSMTTIMKGVSFVKDTIAVRRRITIGCNSKLNSRLIPIRLRSRACNRTLMSA